MTDPEDHQDEQPSTTTLSLNQASARLPQLREMLEEDEVERSLIAEQLADLKPADVAEFLAEREVDEAAAILDLLEIPHAAEVLSETDDYTQSMLAEALPVRTLARLVGELSPDDAVDLLDTLEDRDPEHADAVYAALSATIQSELEPLREHEWNTAGGLMSPNYVAVPDSATLEDALAALRTDIASERADSIAAVYVTDGDGKLCGVLPIRQIIMHPPRTAVAAVLIPSEDIVAVPVDMHQEEVARVLRKYDLAAVPVIDAEERLLGVVTFDDILDVADEEADEDLRRIAGLAEADPLRGGILGRVGARLPWLSVTLGGTFITAMVLSAYEATLAQIAATMFFVPAVTAMSGNVGLQSSMTLVRALGAGEVQFNMMTRLIRRELATGAVIGAVCGSIVGAAAMIFGGAESAVDLGIAVGVAMIVAITISSAVGTVVPLLLDRFGMDPAVGAGPFITTLNDIVALAIYLSIATVLLLSEAGTAAVTFLGAG